jgi:hypothetical protein
MGCAETHPTSAVNNGERHPAFPAEGTVSYTNKTVRFACTKEASPQVDRDRRPRPLLD